MTKLARIPLAKQSPAEMEVSRVAARDLDEPMRCSECGEVRTVMLYGGDWCLCSLCFPDVPKDGDHDA